jgi:hypothetical protein
MRCTFVLEFDDGDGSVVKRVEVMRLHRATENQTPGDVGLSLAEGKSLVNCVQQEFVVEQIERFCASRRGCVVCGVQRRLHDSHCSELKTALGKVFYCRERWKACNCGADGSRYVSPLKNYLTEASTGELRWLHAELGATMPYRQAMRVMDLLLPTSGRDNHVTIRNHTVTIGKSIQHTRNWLRVSIKIMVALLTDYEGCAEWSVGKRAMRRHVLLCEVVSMTRTSDIAARGAGDEAQVPGG